MKRLSSVIRLHRWRLDEKRRALAELQALADRLAGEVDRLDKEMARERASVEQAPETATSFGIYVKAAIERRARLAQSVRQVETQIAAARDELADAFQELKKYEIAQADRERRVLAHRRRRETNTLDEIALIGHQRRQSSGGD